MHTHVYDLTVERKNRSPVTIRFGNRDVAGPDAYPLAVMPLVRAFYAQDNHRVVATKHYANLVPPWEQVHGLVSITKWREAHHGAIVCRRVRHEGVRPVDVEHCGERVFNRCGQKGITTICLPDYDCQDLQQAYRKSIALCRALQLARVDGGPTWRWLEHWLRQQLQEVEQELLEDRMQEQLSKHKPQLAGLVVELSEVT